MERLKLALEGLDEKLYELEDKIGLDKTSRHEDEKKTVETMKHARMREATMLATAQKVASRLDHAIEHVETILRN